MQRILTNQINFTNATPLSVVTPCGSSCPTLTFEGAFVLADGRVVEKYCNHGWMYESFVFENMAEWQAHNDEGRFGKRARIIDITTGG